MAARWPQQYQQTPNQGYESGQYQQHYAQQAYGHPVAGQPYGAHGYVQPQQAQKLYSQPPFDQNVQAQTTQTPQEQSQQQHPQQPYPPPQQYQYGPQHQYHQPGVSTVPTPLPMQASHNACFNCGALDHWAQSCPHPKRDSNAGVANSTPTAKRQKFNAPVVTKYPVPPHVAQAQAAQQAWRPQGYGHSGYAQYQNQHQMPYAPSTPLSANQTPNTQWAPTPQYAHGTTPAYFQQQTGPHQQYPLAPTPPNPKQYYGSHPPMQASSPGQYGSHVQPQSVQPQQPHSMPARSYSTASAHSASPPASARSSHFPNTPGFSPRHPYQGLPPSGSSNQSQISTPMPQPPNDASPEPEEDDLGKLDVPDMPSTQGNTPAALVGRPLPSNFVVADALAPFSPPALGDNGLCKSKYLDRPDANHSDQNVKDTDDWNNHKKDPIFAVLSEDSKLLPLGDFDALHRPYRSKQETAQEPSKHSHPGHPEGFHARGEHRGDLVDSSETDLDDGNYKEHFRDDHNPHSRKRSFSQSQGDDSNAYDKEEAPAAYKTNHKPMHARLQKRPYPPPTAQERSDENDYESRSRSTSPKYYDAHQHTSPPNSGFNGQRFEGKSHRYRRDSYHAQEHPRHWRDCQQPQTVRRPPPPPPPPLRKPSWYDGPTRSPSSAGPPNDNPSPTNGHTTPPNGNPGVSNGNPFEPDAEDTVANGDSHTQTEYTVEAAPTVTPVKLRTERSYGRKRDYSIREASSDDDETPARRQADDVTPKLKRRQPKVAAAYSRRW